MCCQSKTTFCFLSKALLLDFPIDVYYSVWMKVRQKSMKMFDHQGNLLGEACFGTEIRGAADDSIITNNS